VPGRERESIVIGIDSIILMLIVGAIAGWVAGGIARLLGFGLLWNSGWVAGLWNTMIGIVGAFIGIWLLTKLGFLPFSGFVGSIINATIGAVILLVIFGLINRFRATRKTEIAARDFGKRPSGWLGHWSVQYGKVLAGTIRVYPPFSQIQGELLAGIPRPLHEALDPVASTAEPMDRDGKLLAWRLTRSATFDLLGPVGIVIGALALAIVAFSIAVPLLNLPPLTAPTQELQPPKASGQPATQERQQQPPTQELQPPKAPTPPATLEQQQQQPPTQELQPPKAASPPATEQQQQPTKGSSPPATEQQQQPTKGSSPPATEQQQQPTKGSSPSGTEQQQQQRPRQQKQPQQPRQQKQPQ